MKTLIAIIHAVLLTATLVLAAGGKNQGSIGQGGTSTDSSANGDAGQSRAGR